MYYLLFVLFLVIFVLTFTLVDKNKDISRLMVLNNALSDDLNGYKYNQSTLIFRLKELEFIITDQDSLSSFFLGIDWFDSWAFGLDYQALW